MSSPPSRLSTARKPSSPREPASPLPRPVYTVTSLTDTTGACTAGSTTDANCTLRAAVTAANAFAGGGATIQFAPTLAGTQAAPSTITLTNGQLELTQSVTITGPGANLLSISGNAKVRILQVDAGVTATVSGLTLTKGQSALQRQQQYGRSDPESRLPAIDRCHGKRQLEPQWRRHLQAPARP